MPGKFGAVFASIPAPIVAALYCLFFAYVGKQPWQVTWQMLLQLSSWRLTNAYYKYYNMTTWAGAGGLSFLQFCNLNSFRTKFILGFSFFMGLSIPQYFNEYTAVNGYGPVHTGARWVTNYVPWTLLFIFCMSICSSSDLCSFGSSMTWSMYLSHLNHSLLVCWRMSWTSHCTRKTTPPERIGACIGGIGSDHSRPIQEVRNSILCLSISTSSSHQYEYMHRSGSPNICLWVLHF